MNRDSGKESEGVSGFQVWKKKKSKTKNGAERTSSLEPSNKETPQISTPDEGERSRGKLEESPPQQKSFIDDALKVPKHGKGDECPICMDDVTCVRLVPCGHHLCEDCVKGLRWSTVHKPESGSFCPLCRAEVLAFESEEGDEESTGERKGPWERKHWAERASLKDDEQASGEASGNTGGGGAGAGAEGGGLFWGDQERDASVEDALRLSVQDVVRSVSEGRRPIEDLIATAASLCHPVVHADGSYDTSAVRLPSWFDESAMAAQISGAPEEFMGLFLEERTCRQLAVLVRTGGEW